MIVDRPGFGLSDPVDYKRRSYTETVSAVLLDVFENLDIDQATVVGASIGDVWAMTAAEQLGDRVRCVVLLGGGPITAEITPPPFIRLLRSPVGALIVRVPNRRKWSDLNFASLATRPVSRQERSQTHSSNGTSPWAGPQEACIMSGRWFRRCWAPVGLSPTCSSTTIGEL